VALFEHCVLSQGENFRSSLHWLYKEMHFSSRFLLEGMSLILDLLQSEYLDLTMVALENLSGLFMVLQVCTRFSG
jgi:hypothetical protein